MASSQQAEREVAVPGRKERRRAPRWDDRKPVPIELLDTPDLRTYVAPSTERRQPEAAKSVKVKPSKATKRAPRSTPMSNTHLAAPVAVNGVSIFSHKGGVGTSTVSAYLSLLLGQARRGTSVAIDLDRYGNGLSYVLTGQQVGGLDEVAHIAPPPASIDELSEYRTQISRSLDILGLSPDQGLLGRGAADITFRSLRKTYELLLADVGTSFATGEGRVALVSAAVNVIVTSPNRAGLRAAEQSIKWLAALESESKVIVVINGVPARGGEQFVEKMTQVLKDMGAAVALIPLDPALGSGEVASLVHLSPSTRSAFEKLGGMVINALRSHRVLDLGETPAVPEQGFKGLASVPDHIRFGEPTQAVRRTAH